MVWYLLADALVQHALHGVGLEARLCGALDPFAPRRPQSAAHRTTPSQHTSPDSFAATMYVDRTANMGCQVEVSNVIPMLTPGVDSYPVESGLVQKQQWS